jgi:hypothetical protein
MATMPTFKAVSGPGAMFPALYPLPADEDLARFKYATKEYFVSGIALGQPYTTRLVVRRPTDSKKFSGIVVAEPMHPTGNDWMFYFMHTYLMSQGHVAVEIATSSVQLFKDANAARYKDLEIGATQANEILAQVGLLLKNDRPDGPLEGLPVRKMILTGSSASAAAVCRLPSRPHGVSRRGDEANLRRILSDKYWWRQRHHESGRSRCTDAHHDGSCQRRPNGQSLSPTRRRRTRRPVPHL